MSHGHELISLYNAASVMIYMCNPTTAKRQTPVESGVCETVFASLYSKALFVPQDTTAIAFAIPGMSSDFTRHTLAAHNVKSWVSDGLGLTVQRTQPNPRLTPKAVSST